MRLAGAAGSAAWLLGFLALAILLAGFLGALTTPRSRNDPIRMRRQREFISSIQTELHAPRQYEEGRSRSEAVHFFEHGTAYKFMNAIPSEHHLFEQMSRIEMHCFAQTPTAGINSRARSMAGKFR